MEKEITINCKVEERWIPIFVKMFEAMEYCGQIGHSEYVGLYADGDGDFKPKFHFNPSVEDYKTDGYLVVKNPSGQMTMFDAG